MSESQDDFQDFHDAVSKQTTHDDAGQQMKVARTCLEMGMTDAAIQALGRAAERAQHPGD
jgi:hypothetical protein